ncbi:MAG: type IV pilus modification protein PilV [Steroidobacteraceae bacterium]
MSKTLQQKRTGDADQKGFTLVEVLVTLVLTSVGLLGMAALQLTTLKSNQEAYVRSQASMLSGYILDRMRANQRGFLNNEYTVAFDGTGTAGTTAGNDLARWQAEINRLLPGGAANAAGQVARTAGTNIVTVTIRWSERADRVLQEASANTSFQIRSEI